MPGVQYAVPREPKATQTLHDIEYGGNDAA
jgi:hypothetical protein